VPEFKASLASCNSGGLSCFPSSKPTLADVLFGNCLLRAGNHRPLKSVLKPPLEIRLDFVPVFATFVAETGSVKDLG